MTKLHFEDLTKITCPFGMLDDDTQERLMDCDEVEYFAASEWFIHEDRYNGEWAGYFTFRAKPQPKRLVTWLVSDEGGWCFYPTLTQAIDGKAFYGGYIYRIERDEDGSNPTIELVETGGRDE